MNDKYKLSIMFINKSTDHIFQQHLNETDPLLERIQLNSEDDKNDKYYMLITVVLISFVVSLTVATGVILFIF